MHTVHLLYLFYFIEVDFASVVLAVCNWLTCVHRSIHKKISPQRLQCMSKTYLFLDWGKKAVVMLAFMMKSNYLICRFIFRFENYVKNSVNSSCAVL